MRNVTGLDIINAFLRLWPQTADAVPDLEHTVRVVFMLDVLEFGVVLSAPE